MREGGIIPVFALAVYLQLFTAGQSRINRELYKPFVYLVPEPPFAKLPQCLRELFPSALAEAVVVFVPVGLILQMSPWGIVVCVFARISYAFLFQSGNLLLERFWSGASKALILFLYFLILILLTLPGILIAIFLVAFLSLPGGVVTGLLVAGLVNIPVALLLFYLLCATCRSTRNTPIEWEALPGKRRLPFTGRFALAVFPFLLYNGKNRKGALEMEYTFDQVADMLDEMAEAFPPVFLKNSMAVSCSRKRPNWTLCSPKGRFTSWGNTSRMGTWDGISTCTMDPSWPPPAMRIGTRETWKEELYTTLAHELTHHVEGLANAHGLDDKDEEQLLRMLEEYQTEFPKEP